ncbi:hypothetical protein OAV88_04070 [bacterium]|nr:hypothetical protein [bacterium]
MSSQDDNISVKSEVRMDRPAPWGKLSDDYSVRALKRYFKRTLLSNHSFETPPPPLSLSHHTNKVYIYIYGF